MAIDFRSGQVAVGDPAPSGPTVNTNPPKGLQVKVFRLTSANYGTTRVDTKVGAIPGDASILKIEVMVTSTLTGSGITNILTRLGTTAGGIQLTGDSGAAYNAAGHVQVMNSTGNPGVNALLKRSQSETQNDINLWVGGTSVGGTLTDGELFVVVYFVR